jgi:hypothetical protein
LGGASGGGVPAQALHTSASSTAATERRLRISGVRALLNG